MDIKETYQQNSNDQAKETNSAAKDLNDQNLDKEHRIGCIGKSSSRSNLENKTIALWLNLINHFEMLVLLDDVEM